MKISECLDMFLGYCKLRRLSGKTIDNYDRNVKKLINYIGDININDLDNTLVNKYIGYLVDKVKENKFKEYDCKLSKATIATYLRELKVFIKYFPLNFFIIEAFFSSKAKNIKSHLSPGGK